MKKILVLATAALMVGGVALAHEGEKGKRKNVLKENPAALKMQKQKKSCCKSKDSKTAKL